MVARTSFTSRSYHIRYAPVTFSDSPLLLHAMLVTTPSAYTLAHPQTTSHKSGYGDGNHRPCNDRVAHVWLDRDLAGRQVHLGIPK